MRLRLLLATLLLTTFVAAHGAYPEKPIRFIIPSAAGGSPDVLMRILTAELSNRLGVPFVIINKPGPNFVIGTIDIVNAPPDGYTLGYGNIVSLAIDYARKNPDKLVMASGGNGTTGHLGGELFKAMTGTSMLHVPYRGSAQAINDVISGEAQVIFDNLSSITPFAKAGRVRPLGVSGARRSPLFPDIPTIAEAGVPGYQTIAWGGIIGPANLPTEIVEKLHREIVAALQSPAVRKRFAELDTDPDGSTPREFLDLTRRERPRWAEVIKRSGAKLD